MWEPICKDNVIEYYQPPGFLVKKKTIFMALWCLWRSIVENKVCMGTECKEIKSSTSYKEGDQVDRKSTVPSTTPGTD